ncbi:hypothetical protein D0T84_02425 [Dysgonomonas sp. 521]|uniref:hypothetical protein n=1 Tax=Dysgonomonas sp. 521 TaxID=2302932 RepID=UPI0013D6827A|nr:hypothetical protein [Dysgonomonas sp. 521]NDV93772.1 hypothetical protein [Dysgonomonas sp. 521]
MKKKTKSTLLKVVAATIVVLALLFLFRGNIYRMAVKYEDAGGRKSYDIKDDSLAMFINQNLPNDESLDANIDIEQIVDLSQEITTRMLDFSIDAQYSDPQKLMITRDANCVGYAAFTASVGSYLLKRFEMDKEWEAKPKKGKLYLFGNNMHKGVKSGWFKDHDFVVFRNKNSKEEIYADPSIYEYFGIKRVDRYQK